MDLSFSDIETLGNLVRVEGNLNLYGCISLQSIENLEYVGGDLYLDLCQNLESLGNLKYVGHSLYLPYTPLEKKYSNEQIRRMVNVIGHIHRDK